MEKKHPLGKEGQEKLELIIQKIRQKGKNKKYDCVVGVSGGRDSTYTLLTAIKYGLRPLAVHFDNGWNTDISIENIIKAREKLMLFIPSFIILPINTE
jgi:tRNA(Ile)-lysidine synthase TilS/MesJ